MVMWFRRSMTDTAESFRVLSRQSAAVADATEGTSLVLLRKIEETVDTIGESCKMLSGIIEMNRVTAEQIARATPDKGVFLDDDDTIVPQLAEVIENVEGMIPKLLSKNAAIDRNPALRPDQREFLHDALNEMISMLGDLVEASKDLRASIIQFDLKAESRDDMPTFNDADSLIASIR